MNTGFAWALVGLSFFVLAAFPFLAVVAGRISSIKVQVRVAFAVVVGYFVAFALLSMADGFFTAAEIESAKEGVFREEEMFPDMPNLLSGLIAIGWIAVIVGNVLGQAVVRRTRK